VIGETLPLSEHELISRRECAEIANRVHQLSSHWTPRSAGGFYSLGAASYLDAVRGLAPYLAAARATNALLMESFGGLYDQVVAFLRVLLDEDVSLDLDRAAPGFHVFVLRGKNRSPGNPAPRAHFDLQWRLAYPGVRPEGTLSFTLAVATPTGGAGMALWPLRLDDRQQCVREAMSRMLEQPPQTISYSPGRMVLHDGLILHAIGAAQTARATGFRITLQGHGIRLGGRWRLYW
jgi:hypothetical protein